MRETRITETMVGYKTEVGIAEAACYTDDYKIQCRLKAIFFKKK